MPKTCYVSKRFSAASRDLIDKANAIIAEYHGQGFRLTLRQTFYQFVSRAFISNTMRDYKNLGGLINDARLAGLIDWDAIEDRTRAVVQNSHWGSPADIVGACAKQFKIDKWVDQEFRPEVFVEKEALSGIVEGVCRELDIPFLACRGYTSQSEMWSSAMRLKAFADDYGQKPVILHLGDHDPSGIDMTRDITERLELFMGGVELKRLALNMSQVRQYNPPPNPAKVTDSRFESYEKEFGNESWELDALEPSVLVDLIRQNVLMLRDEEKWDAKVEEEEHHRRILGLAAQKWTIVEKVVDAKPKKGKNDA